MALKHPRIQLARDETSQPPRGFQYARDRLGDSAQRRLRTGRAAQLVLLVGRWCNGALLAESAGSAARPDPTHSTAAEHADLAQRYPRLVEMAPHLSLCNFAPAFAFGLEALIRLVMAEASSLG